jgi:hypothetical protein
VTDPLGHPTFDTSVAHIARVYNYLLGGKDNYAADRKAGDAAIEAYPHTVSSVRANRAFLARVVRFLAGEAGIRQFLDIGTGIPTAGNTHEVAQSVAPEARVVYADYDPVVLAHARALMTSHPAGATDYLDADLRDTGKILGQAAATLDFTRPVAVMLIGILHFIDDEDQPYDIVSRLLGAVPSGSYLAISHMASDISATQVAAAKARLDQMMYQQGSYRTQAGVARFFDGLELAEPGVVPIQKWRPDSEMEAQRAAVLWGGVGRKG